MSSKAATKNTPDQEQNIDQGRREFLRKSKYIAYTTPAMMSLVVEKASASYSTACGQGNNAVWCRSEAAYNAWCQDNPDHPGCL